MVLTPPAASTVPTIMSCFAKGLMIAVLPWAFFKLLATKTCTCEHGTDMPSDDRLTSALERIEHHLRPWPTPDTNHVVLAFAAAAVVILLFRLLWCLILRILPNPSHGQSLVLEIEKLKRDLESAHKETIRQRTRAEVAEEQVAACEKRFESSEEQMEAAEARTAAAEARTKAAKGFASHERIMVKFWKQKLAETEKRLQKQNTTITDTGSKLEDREAETDQAELESWEQGWA